MRSFTAIGILLGSGVAAFAQSDAGWFKVTETNSEIKATINLPTIAHDQNGNVTAVICLYQNGVCPAGWTQRWFFNCHNHFYSPIAGMVEPKYAERGSTADLLAAIVCSR